MRQQGRSIASRLLIIAWKPNELHRKRIGFVVSKRISKHAVMRNYIKRLLSEAIRPFVIELSDDIDVVITARQQIIGTDLSTLAQEIETLLRRAKLLAAKASSYEQVERTKVDER